MGKGVLEQMGGQIQVQLRPCPPKPLIEVARRRWEGPPSEILMAFL